MAPRDSEEARVLEELQLEDDLSGSEGRVPGDAREERVYCESRAGFVRGPREWCQVSWGAWPASRRNPIPTRREGGSLGEDQISPESVLQLHARHARVGAGVQ